MTSPAFQDAIDVHDGLRRRLKDLQEYSIPNLRDCKGPLSFQQQLAADVREDIDIFTRELQRLGTLIDDQLSETDKQKVGDWVEEMTEMVQQIRKDTRAALLTSKRNIDAQNKSYKEELLRSNAVASTSKLPESGKPKGDDALMKATNDVTEAFRRTAGLMQQELERSVLTQQMFDESSRTLTSTSDLYSSFTTLLTTSKTLVTALERSDLLDRLLIIASLILFLSVMAYIAKKRIVDRGITLAFWWVKYIPRSTPRQAGEAVVAAPPNPRMGPDRIEL